MKKKYNVIGMTCSACSAHVEKSVNKLDGINSVNVNLLANSMVVDFNEEKLNDSTIIDAVINAGYNAYSENNSKNDTESPKADDELSIMKTRLIYSIIFLLPILYLSMGSMLGLPVPSVISGHDNPLAFAFTQFLLTLPILYVNKKFFIVGFKTLFKGSPNMDTLIALGSTSAFVYGTFIIYKISYALTENHHMKAHEYSMNLYFESAAMILTLITLGKLLETRSKNKTSESISKLMELAPKTATVIRGNTEVLIPIEELAVGDIVIVKPGESIAADGIIIEGNTTIDESAITGESIPVEKLIDDKVISATINKNGYIKFRALKVGDNTTLSQIIKLVEDASSSKAPIAKLADKVSGIFVPIVIIMAILASIIWLILGHSGEFALSIGISVLVISCPCALGLATPVAIMVGTGKGAENGILFKNAEALEITHKIDTVVLDKTGTLTEGKPKVTDIISLSTISTNELLKIAASIEKPSEHPLSAAVYEKAKDENIALYEIDNFNNIVGKGIEATINNTRYIAGNIKLMNDNNIKLEDYIEKGTSLANSGKTPLYFANDTDLLGIIAVADTIKNTSKSAIDKFNKLGIDVVMLTGDNINTANNIGKELGISKIVAEVLPSDKENEIKKLQSNGKIVAMIGDGINDAPALARADVGISIGAGTDIAIETSDIVLIKNDLLDSVIAIELSKATLKNIKQNLFWAFIYNIIGIPVAAGVLFPLFGIKLNPMIAAAAMSLSSVSVVTNALRLKLFNSKIKNDNSEGEIKMEKKITISIEGMMCSHCTGRVDNVLNSIDGVSATVSLENKNAEVTLTKEVNTDILVKAVEDAGYKVISVS